MKKLSKFKQRARGRRASKWQSQNLHPGHLTRVHALSQDTKSPHQQDPQS